MKVFFFFLTHWNITKKRIIMWAQCFSSSCFSVLVGMLLIYWLLNLQLISKVGSFSPITNSHASHHNDRCRFECVSAQAALNLVCFWAFFWCKTETLTAQSHACRGILKGKKSLLAVLTEQSNAIGETLHFTLTFCLFQEVKVVLTDFLCFRLR